MELKDKEAFFAQYWNQDVGVIDSVWNYEVKNVKVNSAIHYDIGRTTISLIKYIELKSLEDIYDEDAKAIGFNIYVPFKELKFYFDDKMEWTVTHKDKIKEGVLFHAHIDILRQRGYLVPWTNKDGRTYTAKELLENGVVKLK